VEGVAVWHRLDADLLPGRLARGADLVNVLAAGLELLLGLFHFQLNVLLPQLGRLNLLLYLVLLLLQVDDGERRRRLHLRGARPL